MFRYANTECPICKQPLKEDDNILVCPECGAPYHADCINEKGKCVFDDLHAKGEEWKNPNKEFEAVIEDNSQLKCSRCGTANPPSADFCEVCGNLLKDTPIAENTQIPMGMPLNPFITPFGGVAESEEIDGVLPKDLAVFVGKNSHYYIPKFKQLAATKGKLKMINFASMIFTGLHFMYRKMYLYGVLTLLIQVILSIPSAIATVMSMSSVLNISAPSIDASTLSNLLFVSNFLTLILRFACGFLSNSLYKYHTYKKIKSIKETTSNHSDYVKELSKRGGVSTAVIFVVFALYLFSMFSLLGTM